MSRSEIRDHLGEIRAGSLEPVVVRNGPTREEVIEKLGDPDYVLTEEKLWETTGKPSAVSGVAWPEEYRHDYRAISGSVLMYIEGIARALIWLTPEGRVERVWVGST